MKKSKDKDRGALLFCMTALLMYMVMPVVSLYVPAIIKVVLIVAVVVLLASDSRKSSIMKIAVKLVPVYILAIVKLVFIKSDLFIATLYDLLGTYVVSCVYLHLFIENNKSLSKKILICVLVFYLITAVTTIIGNSLFPGASRALATGMDGENMLYNTYRSYNIGSFAFVYELVLPVAFLPFVFKQKVLPWWITVGMYILILYSVYVTQYTIALLSVLGYGVCFFIRYLRNPRYLIGYILFAGVLLTVFTPAILSFADRIIDDDTISQRFEEMGNVVSGSGATVDSDVDQRQSLYMGAINGFLANPLTGGKGAGGHSLVLDTMASNGLLGVLMLWIMLNSMFKLYIRPFKQTPFYGYLWLAFIVYLLFIVLNPAPLYMSITFMIPLIAYVLKFPRVNNLSETI